VSGLCYGETTPTERATMIDPETLNDNLLIQDHALASEIEERARDNFKLFCEYVLRDESNEARVRLAPLHILAIDFVEYCRSIDKFPALQLPYEHGKSAIFSVAFPLFCLGRNPNITIKLVSASEAIVKTRVKQIRDYIDGKHGGAYNRVFPHIKADRKTGYSAHQIHVEREVSAFPSVWSHSAMSTGEGGRCGLLILDDVVTRSNTLAKDIALDIIQAVEGTWMQRVHAGGFAILANTPWTSKDLTAHITKSRLKRWCVLRAAVNKTLDGYDVQVSGD